MSFWPEWSYGAKSSTRPAQSFRKPCQLRWPELQSPSFVPCQLPAKGMIGSAGDKVQGLACLVPFGDLRVAGTSCYRALRSQMCDLRATKKGAVFAECQPSHGAEPEFQTSRTEDEGPASEGSGFGPSSTLKGKQKTPKRVTARPPGQAAPALVASLSGFYSTVHHQRPQLHPCLAKACAPNIAHVASSSPTTFHLLEISLTLINTLSPNCIARFCSDHVTPHFLQAKHCC